MPSAGRGEKAQAALEEHGLLLLTDPKLPSVASLVAGKPVRGSWWGHPKGDEIFQVAEWLADRPDVVVAKLVSGKATYVHRRLWPALLAVGGAREPWQLERLSAAARKLLARVDAAGRLEVTGEPARELERALLALGQSVHTEQGSHAKTLTSWTTWLESLPARRRPRKIAASRGKQELKAVLDSLNARFRSNARLPWVAPGRPVSRPSR
jgi:hypothetical protein